MRFLIIGCTGMLGTSIILHKTHHELWGTYVGSKPKSQSAIELDITNSFDVNHIISTIQPDVIINTAALTNVDGCEEQPDHAKKLHIDGTENLVKIAREIGSYLVQISTDSVFDGTKGNYVEDDLVNPLNVYSKTKHLSELKALQYNNSCVVRTNIYGFNWLKKESICEWILSSLRGNKEISLFEDTFFTPILTNNLAKILFEICDKKLTGVYHIAGAESVSKLNFGYKIASIFHLNPNLIKPTSIKASNFKAQRPLNPTLNCEKIQTILSEKLLDVEQGLKMYQQLESGDYVKRLKDF